MQVVDLMKRMGHPVDSEFSFVKSLRTEVLIAASFFNHTDVYNTLYPQFYHM